VPILSTRKILGTDAFILSITDSYDLAAHVS